MMQQQTTDSRRRALIVGNSDYTSLNAFLSQLMKEQERGKSSTIEVISNAEAEDAQSFPTKHTSDVSRLNSLLKDKLNYDTTHALNADKKTMKQMVRDFAYSIQILCEQESRSIDSEDSGVEFLLVYISGYTIQIEGQNYVVPCMMINDDNMEDYVFNTKSDIEDACISMNWIIKYISETCHAVQTKIFIFSSHVNNPFEKFYLSSCMTDNQNSQLIIMKDGLIDTYLPSKSIVILAGPPRIPESFTPPRHAVGLIFTNRLIEELSSISGTLALDIQQVFEKIAGYVLEKSNRDHEVKIACSFSTPITMAKTVTKRERPKIAIPEDFDIRGSKKKRSLRRALLGKASKHDIAKITRSSRIFVLEEDKLVQYLKENEGKDDCPQAYSSLTEAVEAAKDLKEKEMVTIEIDEGLFVEDRVIVLDRANMILQGMTDKQKNHIIVKMKRLKITKANIVINGITFGPSFDEQGYIDEMRKLDRKVKGHLKRYDYDTDETIPNFTIEVNGVNPVKIQNCVVFGSIKVTGSEVTQTEINACTITRAYNRAAICVKGANPQVTNCSIHDNESIGIKVVEKGTGQYEGNGIYNHSRPAIVVRQHSRPVFRNNHIYENNANGIVVEDGGSGVFHSNNLHHNKFSAIYISSIPAKPIDVQLNSSMKSLKSEFQSSILQFTKNKIHDNLSNGVVFTNKCVVDFIENEVNHQHADPAIYVDKGADPRIQGNKIYDNQSNGIVVTDGGKGTYSNNELYRHQLPAISIHGAKECVFKNNTIYNNESHGIVVSGESKGFFENNILKNHNQPAINVTNMSFPEFRQNQIISKTGAIRISDKSGGTFIGNELSEGDKPTVIVGDSCKGVLFQNNNFHDVHSNAIMVLRNASDITISSNKMTRIDKPVIVLRGGCGPQIKIHRNTITDNFKCALYIEKEANDIFITANVIKEHHSTAAVMLEEGAEVHLEEAANSFSDNEENVLVVTETNDY